MKAKPPELLKIRDQHCKITILSSYTIWNVCYHKGDQPDLQLFYCFYVIFIAFCSFAVITLLLFLYCLSSSTARYQG